MLSCEPIYKTIKPYDGLNDYAEMRKRQAARDARRQAREGQEAPESDSDSGDDEPDRLVLAFQSVSRLVRSLPDSDSTSRPRKQQVRSPSRLGTSFWRFGDDFTSAAALC